MEHKEIVVYVKGSAPEPYILKFIKSGNKLSATCSCPAGQAGTYCKHRISIIEGDYFNVLPEYTKNAKIASDLVFGTPIEAALHAVQEADYALTKMKAELSRRKRALAEALLGR